MQTEIGKAFYARDSSKCSHSSYEAGPAFSKSTGPIQCDTTGY